MVKIEKRNIIFDEVKHRYTDDGGNVYLSVTQLLGEVTPKFDEKYWLVYKALEAKGFKVRPRIESNEIIVNDVPYRFDDLYNEATFVAVGVQAAITDIKRNWTKLKDISIVKGNRTHKYLEDCINAMQKVKEVSFADLAYRLNTYGFKWVIQSVTDLDNSPLKYSHPLIYEKLAYFVKDGWTIFAEKRVYSSTHLIAGTIDCLVVKGNQFFIIDWKTNKDELKFKAGYYKKEWQVVDGKRVKVATNQWIDTKDAFLEPLEHLPHCKGEVYTMQLSVYAYICELWGLECMGLILIHVRDNDLPKAYDITYRKMDAEILFNWRLEQFLANAEVERPKFGMT